MYKSRASVAKPATAFAEELIRLMSVAQIGTKDLANAISASYEYVRRIKNGTALPSPHFVLSLAKALGADAELLQAMLEVDQQQKLRKSDGIAEPTSDEVLFKKAWARLDESQRGFLRQHFELILSQPQVHG